MTAGSSLGPLRRFFLTLAIVPCAMLATHRAEARVLAQRAALYPDGKHEWLHALIADDRTSLLVEVVRDGDGVMHLGRPCRANGDPIAVADLTLPLVGPSNLPGIPTADFTTPGGDQGIAMTDGDGREIRFRNPWDRVEADLLGSALAAERSLAAASGQMKSRLDMTMREQLERFAADDLRRTLASGDRWKAELVDIYMKGKHGSAPPAIGCGTDMATESAAIKGLLANRSTMAMKQTPAPGNGQTLLIAPYDPVLAGPATVVDAGGREIWHGEVSAETAVDMSGQPAGLYFLKGAAGLSLSFNVVR